jgi:hypothetical protein
VLYNFKASAKYPNQQFYSTVERRKLHEYFLTPEEQQKADAKYDASCSGIIFSTPASANEYQTRMETARDALHNRFTHEKSALQSVLRSISHISNADTFLANNSLLPVEPNRSDIRYVLLQTAESMPLLAEGEAFLQRPEQLLESDLVWGVVLLLESTRSFIWKNDKPVSFNCRLVALELASEVRSSIELLRETKSNPFSTNDKAEDRDMVLLRDVSELLRRFTSINRFDLYHQSPWVAGSNMSAILGNAQFLGLIVLAREGVFGMMLHMYNMLLQLSIVENIPLLELLCDLFLKEIFLGSRPARRFTSVQNRFLGGSLKWNGKRNKPGYVAPPIQFKGRYRFAKVEQRLNPISLSPFIYFSMSGGKPDQTFWAKIAFKGEKPLATPQMCMENLFIKHSVSETVEIVTKLLECDFIGAFPLAKLNCFKIYQLTLDIWDKISQAYCTLDSGPEELEPLTIPRSLGLATARCFQMTTMVNVDARMMHKHHAAKIKDHSALILMRDVFLEVCEGKKVEDFQWSQI